MNYKNSNTGEVISKECYNKLPVDQRKKYSTTLFGTVTHRVQQDESSGDFLTSLLVAEVTGNAMFGAAIGGDLLGGIVGAEISEELSDNSSNNQIYDTPTIDNTSDVDMGGGDFGGGGGGSDF